MAFDTLDCKHLLGERKKRQEIRPLLGMKVWPLHNHSIPISSGNLNFIFIWTTTYVTQSRGMSHMLAIFDFDFSI